MPLRALIVGLPGMQRDRVDTPELFQAVLCFDFPKVTKNESYDRASLEPLLIYLHNWVDAFPIFSWRVLE